jgi:hypothetical protein
MMEKEQIFLAQLFQKIYGDLLEGGLDLITHFKPIYVENKKCV